MKCKQGDLAHIIFSIRPQNVGRVVKVKEYIGKFSKNEVFQFRGLVCQCPVSDHYWWIESDDLSTLFGPSPQAYIADTWLEPFKSTDEKDMSEEAKELDIIDISVL